MTNEEYNKAVNRIVAMMVVLYNKDKVDKKFILDGLHGDEHFAPKKLVHTEHVGKVWYANVTDPTSYEGGCLFRGDKALTEAGALDNLFWQLFRRFNRFDHRMLDDPFNWNGACAIEW